MFPPSLHCDQLSVDAILVLPAYEGSEGAALTSIAVGAHQSVSTSPVSPVFPSTHLTWTSQTNLVAAMVFGGVIGTVLHSRSGGLVKTGLRKGAGLDGVEDQQRNKER